MKRKLVNLLVPLLFVLLIGSTASGNTITVKNTNDSGPGSLRYAIASANSGDTINFKLIYPATITLTTGTLNIGTSLTISGPGPLNLAISGNNVVRVLYISSGATVRISGVTIENGVAPIGDCVFANGGGGVCNFGTLTLINSTISGNSAGYGGGILNFGTMTVTNSTVSGNVASIGPSLGDGGGICNSNPGTLTLTNSTVSGNSAASLGGGIFNSYDLTSPPPGTMTVTNSTISGNSASDGGGGIFNYSATITVTNSTISGNSGFVYAGGIFNYYGGTLTLKSTIVANSSGGNCGSTGGASSGGNNLSDDASCTFLISTGDLIHTPAGLDPSGLQDNGGPTKTIALLATSFAVDAIPPANCTLPGGTTPVATDQRGLTRPLGPECDIGAFELGVPFSSFSAKLDSDAGSPLKIPPIPPSFDLNSKFTLGTSSNGINPLTEFVVLRLGTYQVTVPANSFDQLKNGAKKGSYVFSGVIGGVSLSIQIVPLGANTYQFKAEGSPVDLTALPNPVAVSLTIGSDAGTTSANAGP